MKALSFYPRHILLVSTLLYVLASWSSGADALNSNSNSNSSVDLNNATCVASAPCELELGKAFGDPWFRAKSGEVNFFQVRGTPQLKPSEVTVTLAYGDVEVYASSGGVTPSVTENQWAGNGVVRLRGWDVSSHDEDMLVIAVNATSDSQYRVLATSDEDVLRLESGLSIRMIQDEGEMRYFSIDIEESTTDLLVSINPYFGDPDMYMSLYEAPEELGNYTLPSKQNFTWQSIGFGADTIQVQGEVLSEICAPNLKEGMPCTYAIGVLAVSNCSYAVQAALRSGWKNLTHISLGEPHVSQLDKEAFDYYALFIPPAPPEEPWETVIITVTPIKGGMQDIYITTNRTREPGPKDYDAKGTNWAGSMTVMFSETSPGFCTDCTIYVGVFGYKEGPYSIVASQGLTKLLEGFPQQGTVGGGKVAGQYYEFYNPPGDREAIQVEVTALTGDPDVYITVGGDDPPGPNNFYWVGGATGSDFVVIHPTDKHFCQNCAYQMGVTSVSNSSFTISIYRGDGGATFLIPGRPQAGQVEAGSMRYYVVRQERGSTMMSVTLTEYHGDADVYVTRGEPFTSKSVIDPDDEATYSWTSKGLTTDTISALDSGESDDQPYLIGVHGVSKTSFSVVATFSQGNVLLQAGIPQRHTLKAGEEMAFGFLVDEEGEDLQITVTPLRGNPGLYAGMGDNPTCLSPDDEEGEDSDECRDWTWACTEGTRRAIHITASSPCDFDMDTENTSPADPGTEGTPANSTGEGDGGDGNAGTSSYPPPVVVSDDCAQSSFGVGMVFATVVAQDEVETSFTVVASLLGKHVTLVPGIPQSAVTFPMVPCGGVQMDGDGPCSTHYETSGIMQEALFMFRVGASSTSSNTGFSLNLVPDCEEGACVGDVCLAGCPKMPAKVYINSCAESRCAHEDMYPSQGNAELEFEVSSAHSVIFIADAPKSAGAKVLCIPSDAGGQPCVYYVGVTAGSADEPPMHLTATMESPRGVSLVVPCLGDVGGNSLPDGAITMPMSRPSISGVKMYEVCALGDIDFKVTVEPCRGKMELLVCDSTCPNLLPDEEKNQYTYKSDGSRTCSVRPPPFGTGEVDCSPSDGDLPEISVAVSSGDPEGKGLDERQEAVGEKKVGDTFFVGVNMRLGQRAQDQEHVLRLDILGEGGVPLAAMLSPKSLPSAAEGVASRAFVESGEATVEWGGAILHSPKLTGVHMREAEDLDCRDYCAFELYAVPARLRDDYIATPCGLKSVRNRFKMDVVYSWQGTAKAPGQVSQATLQELRDEEHDVYVVASCDFECLAAIMRVQCSRTLAAVRSPCQTQYAVFPPAELVSSISLLTPITATSESSTSSEGGESIPRRKHKGLRLFILVVVVAGVCAAGIMYARGPAVGSTASSSAFGAISVGWGSWSGWRTDWGSERQARRGFELTDLGREQRQKSSVEESDEFVVGGGRRGDAEAGPGYASLLSER